MSPTTVAPRPITRREPARFGRAVTPPERVTVAIFVEALVGFARFAGLFLVGATVSGWVFDGRFPAGPTGSAVANAVSLAFLMSFMAPWWLRGYDGAVRIDAEVVSVARPAAIRRLPFFKARARPASWLLAWSWDEVDRLEITATEVDGRSYDVLVLTTSDGASHPIGLARRADVAGVLALAEAAGLGFPSDAIGASR